MDGSVVESISNALMKHATATLTTLENANNPHSFDMMEVIILGFASYPPAYSDI